MRKPLKKLVPFFVSAVLTVLNLWIHMSKFSDSMLNQKNNIVSNGYLSYMVDYHNELPAFSRRPLTTFLIEATSRISGLNMGKSFILVNYTLLFFSGVLIFLFSFQLTKKYWLSLLNLLAYFFTFSILFSFFSPIYSYDEPLQYCLILLGLIAFFAQKLIFYVFFFTLAAISRETSLLLVPALALFFNGKEEHTSLRAFFSVKNSGRLLTLLLPFLFYALFLVVFLWKKSLFNEAGTEVVDRFSCFIENFENQKNAVESIVSLVLALGAYLYFLWWFLRANTPSVLERKFTDAFLLTFAVNTIVVLLMTFARETRLFALPLFFLWPLAGTLFLKELSVILSPKLYYACFKNWHYLSSFLLFNFINYLVSFKIYESNYDATGNSHLFNEYLFVLLLLLSVHFIFSHFLGKNPSYRQFLLKVNF